MPRFVRPSVCPSVGPTWVARRAAPPELCGLRVRLRTIGGGHIVSPLDNLFYSVICAFVSASHGPSLRPSFLPVAYHRGVIICGATNFEIARKFRRFNFNFKLEGTPKENGYQFEIHKFWSSKWRHCRAKIYSFTFVRHFPWGWNAFVLVETHVFLNFIILWRRHSPPPADITREGNFYLQKSQ